MLKDEKKSHPSDQELLLFSDGELSSRATQRIRKHLLHCWECRVRHTRIEGTITEFMEIHRNSAGPIPPGEGPRNLLRARLAALDSKPIRAGWGRFFSARYVQGLAALVLAFVAVFVFFHYKINGAHSASYAGLLPDPKLTPGFASSIAMGDICSMDHDEVVRPVSAVLRHHVFEEYGLPEAQSANYEVDYLITPGLGGADDIRNLWPEPRYNTPWNSYVKDQLEDHLHSLVCGGKLNLSIAQRDIATNWISAYQKYFHTEAPLADRSLSINRDAIRVALGHWLYNSRIDLSQGRRTAAAAKS